MAVTAGTTALVARAWGAGDRDEAEHVTRASLALCAGIALAVSLPALIFPHPLASVFRLDAHTIDLAAEFIRWLAPFQIAFAVHFALGAALRAAGDTRTPLAIGALTNVVNVVLVYGLVFGLFGMPQLGVTGAAIANGVAFAVGALAFVLLWWRGKLVLGAGASGSWERARVRRILDIGYPAGLEQLVWQVGFLVFLWIVSLYGTAPYAAYGIGVTILAFSFLVGFGFSIAASTLVGQKLGANDPAGATRSGWRALRLALIAQSAFGLVIVLLAEAARALHDRRPRGRPAHRRLHLHPRLGAAADGDRVRDGRRAARRRRHALPADRGVLRLDRRARHARNPVRVARPSRRMDLRRADRRLHREGDPVDAALPLRALADGGAGQRHAHAVEPEPS